MSAAWYLVRTKIHQELKAVEELTRQQFTVYFPQRLSEFVLKGKLQTKLEPLFPRYILIQLNHFSNNWGVIRSTRGCEGLVHFRDHYPCMSLNDFQAFKEAMEDMPIQTLYASGDLIEVNQGPFVKQLGVFQKIQAAESGQERAMILLELMGQSQKISIPIKDIRLVSKANHSTLFK